MKRTLSFLLAVLMLLCTLLVSCSTDSDTEGSGGSSSIGVGGETDQYGQPVLSDGIPEELDYKGAVVNILVRDHISRYGDWTTDEGATDALSREIYARNITVSENLGVTLNFIKSETGTNGATINNTIYNTYMAGLGGIDIVSNYQHFGTSPTLLDCYMNLYNEKLTYLDLSKPWWNQNFISAAESFNRLYLTVGDMNLAVYKCAFAMYFNETKCLDYNITADELYGLVLDGKWTIEKLQQYTKNTYQLIDESNPLNDFYGLDTIFESHAFDGWVAAFDCNLTQTDSAGMHTIIGESELQKLYDAADLIGAYYATNDVYTRKVYGGEADCIFEDQRSLFGLFAIGEANGFKDSMTDKYGLLPLPKYNEGQTDYYGGVQDSHDAVSVLAHPQQNYEMISAVLEKLNSVSYKSVRPYFIETLVKFRYLQDSQSGQVIDIILKGTRWDFSDIYAVSTGEIRNNLWRVPLQKGETMSSTVASKKDTMNALLETLDAWLVAHE